MSKNYRPVCGDKPCKECPFRRTAMRGYLGAARPEEFIIHITMDYPLPCHPTIDYRDKHWLEKWEEQQIGKICAGSLIMAANILKVPRARAFPRLPADKELVFATHTEFLDYHNSAETKSWEMGL